MSHENDVTIASPESQAAGYEVKDVNVLLISVLAISCIVMVAVSAVLLNDYFIYTKERIYETQVMGAPSPKLEKIRQHEAEVLETYGVVDKENGIYRIPIDRAMSIMVEQQGSKQ